MKAKTSMEGKYIKKVAEVSVAQAQKKCGLTEKEMRDDIKVGEKEKYLTVAYQMSVIRFEFLKYILCRIWIEWNLIFTVTVKLLNYFKNWRSYNTIKYLG